MREQQRTDFSRTNLPREMVLGRFGMVATFGILVVRQLPGFRFLDLNTQVALVVAIAVGAAVWTWFWLALAAKPDHYTHAIAVALMVASTTAIVVLRPMGIYPFYYAVILAGAAYAWRVGAILAAAVTVLAVTVWWQTGLASPLSHDLPSRWAKLGTSSPCQVSGVSGGGALGSSVWSASIRSIPLIPSIAA